MAITARRGPSSCPWTERSTSEPGGGPGITVRRSSSNNQAGHTTSSHRPASSPATSRTRVQGLIDEKVPELLDEIKRITVEQGTQQAKKINHFETIEFGERLLSEMADAWQLALTIKWLDDPDDGTSVQL